ncbi:hypothetical protein FKM82_025932 [Ascaphus truei]
MQTSEKVGHHFSLFLGQRVKLGHRSIVVHRGSIGLGKAVKESRRVSVRVIVPIAVHHMGRWGSETLHDTLPTDGVSAGPFRQYLFRVIQPLFKSNFSLRRGFVT